MKHYTMTQPDISAFSQAFSQNGLLTLQNILPEELALRVADEFNSLEWKLQIKDYTQEAQLDIPLSEVTNRDNLIDVIYSKKHSLDLSQLFYIRLVVDSEFLITDAMQQVIHFLNSEGMLTQIKAITGIPDINQTWLEATCYDKGCFLGNHKDDHHPDNRLAFVLNFTRNWKTDWGGLLLLEKDPNSQPLLIPPIWNSLTIFKVPIQHTVTAVTQAATEHRYSVTGWFRP